MGQWAWALTAKDRILAFILELQEGVGFLWARKKELQLQLLQEAPSVHFHWYKMYKNVRCPLLCFSPFTPSLFSVSSFAKCGSVSWDCPWRDAYYPQSNNKVSTTYFTC